MYKILIKIYKNLIQIYTNRTHGRVFFERSDRIKPKKDDLLQTDFFPYGGMSNLNEGTDLVFG